MNGIPTTNTLSQNMIDWLNASQSEQLQDTLWEKLSKEEQSLLQSVRHNLQKQQDEIIALEYIKKQFEKQLAFYISGLHALAAPIFMKDHNTQYIFANSKFKDMFGIPEETDIIGKRVEAFSHINPQEKVELANEDEYVLQELKTAHREIKFTLADGVRRCWSWTTGFKDSFGTRGIIGTFTNITTLLEENDELSTQIGELAASKKQFELLAQTDQLTGLFNKLSMNTHMQRLIRANELYDTPFSAIMFDIDHFKMVNDQYGHLEGDTVLRAAGRVLMEISRKIDISIRYGGEEFLLLLPGTHLDNAKIFAQRLCYIFPKKVVKSDGKPVTISVGATEFKKGEAIEDLVRRADSHLYTAKRSGRNQVIFG